MWRLDGHAEKWKTFDSRNITGHVVKKIFLAVVLIFAVASCENPYDVDYFQIKADSIRLAASIRAGETASAKIFGYIGSNLCYGFHRFEVRNRSTHSQEIIIWGSTPSEPQTCAQTMSYLSDDGFGNDGRTFSFVPRHKGNFTLTILQPDGSKLSKTVLVE